MEAEEKELRNQLIVLEEQKFMVQQMLKDARAKRRLDEVASLGGNLAELESEIDRVTGVLGGFDWERAYTAALD